MSEIKNAMVPVAAIKPHPRNYKIHPESQIAQLGMSHARLSQFRSLVLWQQDDGSYITLAGHGILEAMRKNGVSEVRADIHPSSLSAEDAEAILLADNLHAQHSSDEEALRQMLESLGESYLGGDDSPLEDTSDIPDVKRANLAERFIIPPFSVLDARQGYWQERKRAWLALGIQSELGRGENALDISASMAGITDPEERDAWNAMRRASPKHASPGGSLRPAMTLGNDGHTVRGDGYGRPLAKKNGLLGESEQARSHYNASSLARSNGQDLMRGEHTVGKDRTKATTTQDWVIEHGLVGARSNQSGTSIFDPVLCELAYRWFSPPDGLVLDPFAGGSVRGIVAAKTGRRYVGIDLRAEQIAANEIQARAILDDEIPPRWIVGDSRNVTALCPDIAPDLIFTCPPYFDLEVYSDDQRDLSASFSYDEFLQGYRAILKHAISKLKDNRFVCIVVGDIRDKKGLYRNFVSDAIAACQDAGARLYNEAILVTSVGSLPIRVGKQFTSGRKLGKTHQNVLVFVKGDPRQAVQDCGPVVVEVPEDEEVQEVSHA